MLRITHALNRTEIQSISALDHDRNDAITSVLISSLSLILSFLCIACLFSYNNKPST